MTEHNFVGIDISKDKFDAAIVKEGKTLNKVFPNTLTGIKSFYQWISKHITNPWICMEATGCYGYPLADYVYQQNVNVSVINPLQIKHYAKAVFMRNKNDALDARLIRQFGEVMKPRLYSPKSSEQKELRGLVNLSHTFKMQLIQLNNQLSSIEGTQAKKMAKKAVKALERNIADAQKKLAALVKQDASFNEQLQLISSIKGVGNLTAYQILARIQDIHQFENAKQFAAFIGVSPRQCQSGKYKGKTRMSCLGDASLRKALYMAALVAKQHNLAIQPFVQRLTLRGKAPKSIIGAVMRKLAHWIFGVLKHNKPFDAAYA